MDQYSEAEVKDVLTDYHDRIVAVLRKAFDEWVETQNFRADRGFGPLLYPRTVANLIFDAIARYAKAEFQGIPGVRVIDEPQTIKVCFKEIVIARFKKGDDSSLGRNIETQAVLDFINPQRSLPNFPPEAAKVEFLYLPDELGVDVGKLLVVARDYNRPIWAYELNPSIGGATVIRLPLGAPAEQDVGEPPLVVPKRRDDSEEIG